MRLDDYLQSNRDDQASIADRIRTLTTEPINVCATLYNLLIAKCGHIETHIHDQLSSSIRYLTEEANKVISAFNNKYDALHIQPIEPPRLTG